MAGELHTLTFAATTYDTQHWDADTLAAADASDDRQDWIFEQLREAMHTAGQAFINAHPDVFVCELT